jgi:hypothetical protein
VDTTEGAAVCEKVDRARLRRLRAVGLNLRGGSTHGVDQLKVMLVEKRHLTAPPSLQQRLQGAQRAQRLLPAAALEPLLTPPSPLAVKPEHVSTERRERAQGVGER